MAATESDNAAKLIERLLVDPAFRARFRRNPAAACREAGLESLAQEMQIGAGKAMMTLDLRESKSSLAGVMMAAAMEGVGVVQFAEHVAPHLDDIPEAIGDVLSRINLPAIGGGLAGAPEPSAPPPPPKDDAAGANGAPAAAAAAAPAAAPPAEAPAAAPEEAAAAPEAAAAGKAATPEAAAAAAPAAKAEAAAEKIEAAEAPEAKTAAKAAEAVAEIAGDAEDLPGATDMPSATAEPQASVDVGGKSAAAGAPAAAAPAPAATPEQAAAAPAPAATPEQAAAAPDPTARAAPAAAAAPVEAAVEQAAAPAAEPAAAGGASRAPDPSEYGLDGKGGEASPEGLALLKNKNITLDETGVADIKAGKIDPRVIAMLTSLSEDHELTVTSMCSDHPRSTAGGSISNHSLGRGFDIGTVDGEIVRPNSTASRELATELSELPESIRPNEIGTPWAINGPGYFTDGAHQDHLHMGFKQEIAKDWKPPAGTAAGASASAAAPAAAAAAAATAVPGAPAAAAAAAVPTPAKPGASGQFMAVKAEAAGVKKGDSGAFMAVAQPPQAAAAAAAAEPAPAGAADAAAASADLSGVSGDYPGDDAPKEQLAAWLGKEAEKRGLPPELPVMASLVESGVKNLNFGDADSVGFFQMRVGIWNQGEYEGFPEKPELQAKWFLDTAEQVKKARVAAGKPIDDPSQFGEWIADVERPAEQYRGRYQLRLDEAKGLLEKGAGSTPAAPAADDAAAKVAAAAPEAAAAAAPAAPRAGDSGQFMAAKAKSSGKRGTTVQFMKSVSRADGVEPAAASAAEPAAAAPPADAAAPAPAAAAAAADAAARSSVGVTPLEDLPQGPDDYPGNSASKGELAKWLAKEAKKAGLPPELPVMASLVESGVKNLNYGDADSVGFFQMRVGIWNQGDYEGFPEKPELQAKWFIDNALAVKKAAIARGEANFGKDPADWGEWIADIERPAAQYRGRYQLRLKEAQGLLKS